MSLTILTSDSYVFPNFMMENKSNFSLALRFSHEEFNHNKNAILRILTNFILDNRVNLEYCMICVVTLFLLWLVYNCGRWVQTERENKQLISQISELTTLVQALETELNVYKEHDNAKRNYVSAKNRKKIAKLNKVVYSQNVIIHTLQNRNTGKALAREIINIIEEIDGDDNNNEQTLTQLKERAKELGITLLSKYNWDGRKALLSAIRDRERLNKIFNLVTSLSPT